MAQLDYILHQQQAATFLEFIAKCKHDLQQYAEREDAKQRYIDKRNAEIAVMYTYYEQSTDCTEALHSDCKDELSRGVAIGYTQKERELQQSIAEVRYFDKEQARQRSRERAEQSQPDLF